MKTRLTSLLTILAIAITLPLTLSLPTTAFGGSATWTANPTSGDWNTSGNWTPMTVPNGPSDTATFGFSNITTIVLSADTELDGIVFTADATSSYTIDAEGGGYSSPRTVTFSGSGITNNSSTTPEFLTGDYDIVFRGSASAGNMFIRGYGGVLSFFDTSTAASGDISTNVGWIVFNDSSSGGSAGLYPDEDASLFFYNTSNAGNANIGSDGTTGFYDSSSAGRARIYVFYRGGNGGQLFFNNSSTGDLAQIDLEGLDPTLGMAVC